MPDTFDSYSPHNYGDLFGLKEPIDVLEKLKYDHGRLQERKGEPHPYHIFDFFITAHSLFDWVRHSQNLDAPTENKYTEIARHIANAAKHFKLTNSRNNAIKSIYHDSYVESDYVENLPDQASYFDGTFSIDTKDGRFDIRDVARETLKFWEGYMESQRC